MIVGIDEVGRGAWAGPLCVAAAALGDVEMPGLTDSKKLSEKKRKAFSLAIKRQAPLVGIGWVSARDIDRIGMSEALKLAARRAVGELDMSKVTQIIIDGTIQLLEDPRAVTMKQADLLVPSVSAASVIAKVARDNYMADLGKLFPEYGFEKHVGYGTAIHSQAIQDHGPTAVHRMSFSPLSGMKEKRTPVAVPSEGQLAEAEVSRHLLRAGFEIRERNWKTKWCEIDIIAEKVGRIHFIEVKYRRSHRYGDGLAAITPKKLRQMKFAAELWLSSRPYDEAVLSVASVTGEGFSVEELLDLTA